MSADKCITICQPYAHLIVIGQKRVENRTWPTRYRGPLWIHAGKSREWLEFGNETDAQLAHHYGEPVPFGALVGRCDLVDCIHVDDIWRPAVKARHPWLALHEHTNGPYCWVLDNVQRLAVPVPMRGRQGLFDLPPDVAIP